MQRPVPLAREVIEQMCVLSGLGRPERVTPRTGGELSGVFEASSGGSEDPVIVKVYAEQWAWKQPKELYVYGLLGPVVGWAIPKIIAARSAENDTGHAFTVMTRLPGQPLSEIAPQLNASAIASAYREIGALAAAIHRVEQDAFGYIVTEISEPMPTNAQYMARQFNQKVRAFRELGGAPALADRIEHRVIAQAAAFAACRTASLCHNDLHEGNLLVDRVSDDHWTVCGLVDVENAIAADPMLDLAKTDCYSIRGDLTKLDALVEGYGLIVEDAEARLTLYRIYHTLDSWVWYQQIGQPQPQHQAGLTLQLERLMS